MIKKYPPLTVRNLLQTDLVSPLTKSVLNKRLQELDEKYEPSFFNEYLFKVLQIVCNRLIPQFDNEKYVDLASSVDRRLAEGKNDGWRYAFMPKDGECYVAGLTGIDETATTRHSKSFIDLEPSQQDSILLDVQQGKISDGSWEKVSSRHFFQELLAELTEAYYSHPLAQEEIGYVGMADVHGWKAITLNNLDPHEPLEKL